MFTVCPNRLKEVMSMEQSRRNLKRIHGGKVEIVYEVYQGLLEIHDNQTTAEWVDFRSRLR